MLRHGQGWRFAGGADRDNAIGAAFDVKFDQTGERAFIDGAVIIVEFIAFRITAEGGRLLKLTPR